MPIALLAQRNHLFHVRTDSLGLGYGRLNAVFHDNRRDQVAQQCAAVAGVASEFETCIAMAHGETLFRKYPLGIPGLGDESWGTHILVLLETDLEVFGLSGQL